MATTPDNRAPEFTDNAVRIISAGGAEFSVQFHRTAYRCWHVVFPHYVDPCYVEVDTARGDYTYHGPKGGAVLATSSLARAMAAVAEQISRTEY